MGTSRLYQQFNFQANISPYFNVFKYFGAITYRRFLEKFALKNFTKFTGKHLYQSFFLNKIAGLNFDRNFEMCTV